MIKKPFFSISIPTYNRPDDLQNAIKNILSQDFNNWEIVVTDNSSNHRSQQVCQGFQDQRIKYYPNGSSIGFARNLYKAIKKASGEYVILLGDDDLIANKDALSSLYRLIKRHDYGYIRMNFYYYKKVGEIFDLGKLDKMPSQFLPRNSNNLDVVEFIYNSNFTFISGVIFKNDKKIVIPEIENVNDPDFQMEHFWIKFVFAQAKKYGGYVDLKDVILAKFIINVHNTATTYVGNPTLYSVINGKIYLEKTWKLVFEELNPSERRLWTKKKTEKIVPLLPSVKYYSNNHNLFLFVRRMLELNPNLYFNPLFYFFTIIALLMPRFLWDKLRTAYHRWCEVKNKFDAKN